MKSLAANTPVFRSVPIKAKKMKFKYATFTNNGETRICFSREEILAMRNSIDDKDQDMQALILFLNEMESKIIES